MTKLLLSLAAAGLVSCLSCGCKSADAENERQTLQMLKEINQKLDAIDARLKKNEERKPVNIISRMNNNTNLVALEKITLPENPTREQVSEYIQKIVNASREQRSFSSNDLQVAMLSLIGHKNLDLLLKYYSSTFYIQYAVQNMATKDDKEIILKALKENRDLIRVVLRMGWEKDVKDLIIQELKNNRNVLPPEWIDAAVMFKDPKIYPDLIEYLINGGNCSITYKAIKKLPGIELEDAVAKMWDKKRLLDSYWERDNAAMIAAEWGHLDALGYLINWLKQPQPDQHMCGEIRNTIWQVTEQSGSPEELDKWFKENGDKLTFDKKTGKYAVKKTENAQ